MKKIDKLILTSFIGPFIMTFFVVVFILLTQHMLKYFDDIIGKDLGWSVLGTLLFYFAIFMIPVALPLAILLSSLITFGNLGEHFELTAVKSLGISMLRSLLPIFCFVIMLTGVAFWVNNNLVPKAALEAYSLMYDIKQKKPAMDLREGAFYNSIPDISIKVNDRLKDQTTLKGVIIYDHRGHTGNKEVIMADSGKMYTILNGQYLKFELFKGYRYTEGASNERDLSGRPAAAENFSKTKFYKMQVVFDLSSFALQRTEKKWFQGNRIMRNMIELNTDMDSVHREMDLKMVDMIANKKVLFRYHFQKDTIAPAPRLKALKRRRDSLNHIPPSVTNPSDPAFMVAHGYAGKLKPLPDSLIARAKAVSDSVFALPADVAIIDGALGQARVVKSQFQNDKAMQEEHIFRYNEFDIQWHKIFSNSLACIAMFLIGAPLGAIIKKGGLGIPVLVSILFFIMFYILSATGEKWAKANSVPVVFGIWLSDAVLFVIGLIFLRTARADARLFEADFYSVLFDKIKMWFTKRKNVDSRTA